MRAECEKILKECLAVKPDEIIVLYRHGEKITISNHIESVQQMAHFGYLMDEHIRKHMVFTPTQVMQTPSAGPEAN